MLEAIVGGVTAERVLLYLQAYDEAYGREIASTFGLAQSQVQKQWPPDAHADPLDRCVSRGFLQDLDQPSPRIADLGGPGRRVDADDELLAPAARGQDVLAQRLPQAAAHALREITGLVGLLRETHEARGKQLRQRFEWARHCQIGANRSGILIANSGSIRHSLMRPGRAGPRSSTCKHKGASG